MSCFILEFQDMCQLKSDLHYKFKASSTSKFLKLKKTLSKIKEQQQSSPKDWALSGTAGFHSVICNKWTHKAQTYCPSLSV